MGNHYHLVLHTWQANVSRLMRKLNGVATPSFNRRHGSVGRLFQGRFKAILVDRNAYLLAVCCYVELNPGRVGLVRESGTCATAADIHHRGLRVWIRVRVVRRLPLGNTDVRCNKTAYLTRTRAEQYAAFPRHPMLTGMRFRTP